MSKSMYEEAAYTTKPGEEVPYTSRVMNNLLRDDKKISGYTPEEYDARRGGDSVENTIIKASKRGMVDTKTGNVRFEFTPEEKARLDSIKNDTPVKTRNSFDDIKDAVMTPKGLGTTAAIGLSLYGAKKLIDRKKAKKNGT